ncbi:MAG: lysophospholipid acyltransferase family protein [bacterium]|nr:lysophospholipid acyltransferase family protein [bacterium]
MIRTIWVWGVGIFLTVTLGLALILFSFFDRRGTSLHRIAKLWARGILAASGVVVSVDGAENLVPGSPQILASNHQGYFDIFALFCHVPLLFGWIAKKELYRIPVFAMAMRRFGNIEIDRSSREGSRESLRVAAGKIRGGRSVLIFPEGTRTPDGEVKSFKKGVYHLAEASGVPVIPISISGSYEIMPKGSFRLRPGTIRLVICKPLWVDGSGEQGSSRFLEALRKRIMDNQVFPRSSKNMGATT